MGENEIFYLAQSLQLTHTVVSTPCNPVHVPETYWPTEHDVLFLTLRHLPEGAMKKKRKKKQTCIPCTAQYPRWWSRCRIEGFSCRIQSGMTCTGCTLWCPSSRCPCMNPACRSPQDRKPCTLGTVWGWYPSGLLLCTPQPCICHSKGSNSIVLFNHEYQSPSLARPNDRVCTGLGNKEYQSPSLGVQMIEFVLG
jgi:hypothetical protein